MFDMLIPNMEELFQIMAIVLLAIVATFCAVALGLIKYTEDDIYKSQPRLLQRDVIESCIILLVCAYAFSMLLAVFAKILTVFIIFVNVLLLLTLSNKEKYVKGKKKLALFFRILLQKSTN